MTVTGPGGTDSVTSIPERPSSKSGRTYITAQKAGQSTDQTVYSVTGGKKFYCTSLVISGTNTDAANPAQLNIKDNTTVLLPFTWAAAGLGAALVTTQLTGIALTFLEPLQFSTSVVADVVTGTLLYSVAVVGYEE